MIMVINIKKLRIPALILLLFLMITAIIIIIVKVRTEPDPVPAMASISAYPTLVIDAGHGGADGGASAADGTVESLINLQIALRMEQLAKLFGAPAVMTRTGETLDYPPEAATIRQKKNWDQKTRIALINATENAVLISVHQNTYPDARPSGSQVLYSKTAGSSEFAEIAHANLIGALNPENRRVAAPISNRIYLLKSVSCPEILVECGFLSNPAEAAKLGTGEYQTELAAALIGSYLQYIGES